MILFWLALVPLFAALLLPMFVAGAAVRRRVVPAQMRRATAHRPGALLARSEVRLAAAWREAETMGGPRNLLAQARESCDRLALASAALPLDATLLEWAAFVRERVPELVAACRAALIGVRGDDRAGAGTDLATVLAEVAEEAERRLAACRQDRRHAFAALCDVTRRRTGAGDPSPLRALE